MRGERRPRGDIVIGTLGLRKYFPVKGGVLRRTVAMVRAVDGVDLQVRRGETLALVGESGCGKTTLGRLLLQLLEPTEGEVLFDVPAEEYARARELWHAGSGNPRGNRGALDPLLAIYSITRGGRHRVKPLRRLMQPVFQDPFTSLNPRMLVKDIVAEPILINRLMTRAEALERVQGLLREVGLGEEHLYRYPHEFSGGQRQRIAIARALAPGPEFLVLDEPTSALDVSVQAQILNLLRDIQRRQGLTYLLITHNLSVVKQMADRVAVMYMGKIVEEAPTGELFASPLHPYTRALLAAVPVPDPQRRRERIILAGDLPSPIDPPAGCRFHTRCGAVMPHCGWEARDLAPAAAYVFDSTRNPQAQGLPPLRGVAAQREVLDLVFYGEPGEPHREQVAALAAQTATLPGGMAFRAIQREVLRSHSIGLELLPPREPPLREVSPGHFVSCYLYEDREGRPLPPPGTFL